MTQSSDNFEINENDIFQKLNQNKLIKKIVEDSDKNDIKNNKIDDEDEKQVKHLNLNSDN